MIITRDEERVLAVLEKDSGVAIAGISDRTGICFSSNRRSNSGQMARLLQGMEVKGLVRRLDDEKPIAWCRTSKGTEAHERSSRRSG